MSDSGSPDAAPQPTSLRRRAHAKKTCVECRRKRARCDLPDTSVPCSTAPLTPDKVCHRCKMLGVPCIVSDEGLKRKRGSDGTGTPAKAKASSSANGTTPARAKAKGGEQRPRQRSHSPPVAAASPDANLSRSRANSMAASKRDPLSLHGAGVNSRLHLLNPFPGPLQVRSSEALGRADAAGSPGAASSASSSYRSRVGLPSAPSAPSPRGPDDGSATTPVAAAAREGSGTYLYHSQSGGQGSSSRSFKMATSFNRRPLALLSELCRHQPGFGEELGRKTLTNFLSQSLDVLGVVSEELAAILERDLPELLLFFPHLPSLRALREEHKVAPTISTSVLLSLMYQLLCAISDPIGARTKIRNELNSIITRDAPHLITGSRDLNAITALELLSVYAPLTLSPPMSHRKSATSPPSAARAGTRVSGEGLIMVAMAIARSFRMNEAPAKLSRLVEEEGRAGLRSSPEQRRSRLEQVVEQLHFAAQWYSLCTWEACAAFADQDIVIPPAPSPGFNPSLVLGAAQDLLVKSIGADALDESAETFAARNVGRLGIARRLRVYEMTFDGFGVMTNEVRWADEVTEKRNQELITGPGREDQVEQQRKDFAKEVHGRVLENMERFLDRWLEAHQLDSQEREKSIAAIRIPKQLRGRVRGLLDWLAMESVELHSVILTNILIVATLTRNFGVLQGPPTPSLILETISKNMDVTIFAAKISYPVKDGNLGVNSYMAKLIEQNMTRDEAVRQASVHDRPSAAARARQNRADSVADVATLERSMPEDAAPLSIRAVPLLWSCAMAVSAAKHSMETCAAALYGWRNLSTAHDELEASVKRLGELLLLLDTDAVIEPDRRSDSVWQQNKIMQGCLPTTAAVLVVAMGRAMEEWRIASQRNAPSQAPAHASPPTPPISAGRPDAKDPFNGHDEGRAGAAAGAGGGGSHREHSSAPTVLSSVSQRGPPPTPSSGASAHHLHPHSSPSSVASQIPLDPRLMAYAGKPSPLASHRTAMGAPPAPPGNGWTSSTNGYYQGGGAASPASNGTVGSHHTQMQSARTSFSYAPSEVEQQQQHMPPPYAGASMGGFGGPGGGGGMFAMGPPPLGGAPGGFAPQPSAVDLMLDDMLGGFDWVPSMSASGGGGATGAAHGVGQAYQGAPTANNNANGMAAVGPTQHQHQQPHLNGQHVQSHGMTQRFGGGGW